MICQPSLFDQRGPHFDGPTYDPAYDHQRLTRQVGRVYDAMRHGHWLTLSEIAAKTRDPEASVSARLRDLRKHKFGAYTISRRHRGERATGLYEYRMVV